MGMKARVLDVLRRGRPVAWTPEWMNLGNLLFLGQWSYEEPGGRVLLHERHVTALRRLAPRLLDEKFIARKDVPFTARRAMPWREDTRPEFYEPAQLDGFVGDLVLPGSEVASVPDGLAGALVVNVRRGDYYSVPEHRAEFGMNQIGYVREAVERSLADNGVPARFVVVSDDSEWCRRHLAPMLAPIAAVEVRDGDVAHDLATVVHAQRLVLPNSTFSYWGGYIGDVLYPGREVTAPWFWARSSNGGRAHLLRRHWRVVGDGVPEIIDD